MPETVLIVDDDPAELNTIDAVVRGLGYEPATANGGDAALKLLVGPNAKAFECVLLDLVMPDLDGLGVLTRMRKLGSDVPVIALTAHGALDNIASAMSAGAADFVEKPVHTERLKVSLRNALATNALANELQRVKRYNNNSFNMSDLIARSQAMQGAMRKSVNAATASTPLLIEGESGTGKELFARAIHGSGTRQFKPFVAIKCKTLASLPKMFAATNGGTLFLDEIAELIPSAQEELLRFLQEGEIDRGSGHRALKVDTRIISGTRHNLLTEIKAGRFREDLFYRLHVTSILLPPLRQRPEDIASLARHFLARMAAEQGKPVRSISAEALALLTRHQWPGNMREFETAIFRAAILADGDEIGVEAFAHIAAQIEHRTSLGQLSDETFVESSPAIASSWPEVEEALPDTTSTAVSSMLHLIDLHGEVRPLEEIETEVIRFALTHYQGQMSEVARRLQIGRSTLYRKLEPN